MNDSLVKRLRANATEQAILQNAELCDLQHEAATQIEMMQAKLRRFDKQNDDLEISRRVAEHERDLWKRTAEKLAEQLAGPGWENATYLLERAYWSAASDKSN